MVFHSFFDITKSFSEKETMRFQETLSVTVSKRVVMFWINLRRHKPILMFLFYHHKSCPPTQSRFSSSILKRGGVCMCKLGEAFNGKFVNDDK